MSGDDYCYLTTTGRRTGRPHRIEIWYERSGSSLYLLAGAGGSSDWVRKLVAEPQVRVERDGTSHPGTARVLDRTGDEEADRARSLVFAKYLTRGHGDLSDWRHRALPVAIDLQG